ncbi:MAG: hypothetical protein HZB85_10320 [Deltaproteobacteria bacterium]|nr:hypothetical protein [Deltaproteobacteria bacterium]
MEETGAPGQRLIGRDFNLRFGARLLAIIVAGVLALAEVLYYSTSEDLGGSYREAIYTISLVKIRVFPLIFASYYTAVVLGLVTLAIAIISVIYSHRIAGPIYRLEKSMDALAEGDLTVDTRFRGYDALAPAAGEINAAVRVLNHRARSCRDAIELIGVNEARVREILGRERLDEAELARAVDALKTGVAELKRACETLKTRE